MAISSMQGMTLNNRYQVLESLGRGGMAEVYKVWDTQRGTHLAMKILREDLAEDRVFLRRFQREAHNLARLQHPNIVRFYGMEQEEHIAFILMDFIDGITLRRRIFDAKGPLPIKEILDLTRQISSALHYAHQQGIVHCDLKSANIMLDANGKVYLTDFGIARMSDAATATLVGVGTPAYMAPELVKGMDPSPQTDIYALGVLLYELLTGGERPFTGEKASITGTTAEKVRWEQLNQTPVSPRVYNPAIPGALEKVVLRCLDKDPEKRYPDALDLLNALQTAVPMPVPEPQTRRGASQATDQPRKRTTGPESARSGRFEDGVYREAAPDKGESAPQHAPAMGQAAASKQPPSGKRVSAGKHFNYALVFICAMGLLGLIASISSAQMNRREEMDRQATQSAAYEEKLTTETQEPLVKIQDPIIADTQEPLVKIQDPIIADTVIRDNCVILYISNGDIFTQKIDGTDIQQLTYELDARNPEWSPDGSHLVFSSEGKIYSMNFNGIELNYIIEGQDPTWSPDGTQIAFSDNGDIYIYSLSLGNLRLLTEGEIDGYEPNWSRDGNKIVFSSYYDGERNIFTMNTSGGSLKRITSLTDSWSNGNPDWSPDNTHIAFSTSVYSSDHIYIIDIDGNGLRRLTYNHDNVNNPSWSPSGEWIAFNSNGKIFIIKKNGDNAIELKAGGQEPDWSPSCIDW